AFNGTGNSIELMTLADFDNDGDLDLFYINDSEDSTGKAYLFENDGNGGFRDVSSASGLNGVRSVPYLTNYGNTLVADFDNDGLQDLLVAGLSHSSTVRVFRNTGNLRFAASDINFGESGGSGPNGWEASSPRA